MLEFDEAWDQACEMKKRADAIEELLGPGDSALREKLKDVDHHIDLSIVWLWENQYPLKFYFNWCVEEGVSAAGAREAERLANESR